MTCNEAREALLTADLRTMTADDELAIHVRGCAECGAVFDTLLARTTMLATTVRARSRRRRSIRALAAATLPIAAGVVAIVSFRFRSPTAASSRPRTTSLPVVRHVSLTVERGQTATVLKTADPSVTVIWLSPGVGQ